MMNSEHSTEDVVIATNVPILPANEWTEEQVEIQNKIISCIILSVTILGGGLLTYFIFHF
jgi:hypothetical protein